LGAGILRRGREPEAPKSFGQDRTEAENPHVKRAFS
jgi:hypothetical protein